MSIKTELKKLQKEYKKNIRTLIETTLTENAKNFFTKHSKVYSVKINCSQYYNDNDYSTHINNDDGESIKINEFNYYEIEDVKDLVKECGLTETEHMTAGDDACDIFKGIDDDYFIDAYGKEFSLEITPTSIKIGASEESW